MPEVSVETLGGGTLIDCANNGEIANESKSVSALTAGIAGASYQGIIDKCTNKGRVSPIGGHCGGICASNNEGRFRYSDNGRVIEGGANNGSICGWNNGKVEKSSSSIDTAPIGDGYPMVV